MIHRPRGFYQRNNSDGNMFSCTKSAVLSCTLPSDMPFAIELNFNEIWKFGKTHFSTADINVLLQTLILFELDKMTTECEKMYSGNEYVFADSEVEKTVNCFKAGLDELGLRKSQGTSLFFLTFFCGKARHLCYGNANCWLSHVI